MERRIRKRDAKARAGEGREREGGASGCEGGESAGFD